MLPFELIIQWAIRTFKRWRRENLERQALDWPRAFGVVINSCTKRGDATEPWNNWVVELHYSYVVSGEYYSGVHSLPAGSEGDAADEKKLWNERKLIVRYSPTNVSTAVILMHDQT